MATTKVQPQIPENYVSPIKHLLAEERIDDTLACIAMLTNQTLATIKEQAFKFGLPRHGPAWVYNELAAKLLFQWGLIGSPEKEASDMAALPDVAILTSVDWNDDMEFGRSVIWHHVRGTADQPAFHYVLDPAPWLDEKHRITADFRHLKLVMPLYYIEVTPRPDTAAARKGK